jgi:sec-independent protein translocase protein TatC
MAISLRRKAKQPTFVVDDEGRMTLMEHLTELRDRIIKVVLAVAVGMVIGFLLYNWLFHLLLGPYKDVAAKESLTGGKLLLSDPLGGFAIRMKMSAYSGIAIAMPVILWQLWRFITPGLYAHEKRYAIPFLVSALTLFIMGALLAFYTLPRALQFLISVGGKGNFVTAFAPDKYFTLIVYMMLAFGIGFEFPIVLVFLQLVGVLSVRQLVQARRYAIVGICIVVAVITPSGDPISMLMLALPMCLFYEASIVIGRLLERRKRTAAAAS